jgi:hypothetical protein
MRISIRPLLLVTTALLTPVSAQTNVQWVNFTSTPSAFRMADGVTTHAAFLANGDEANSVAGDFDANGYLDLAIATRPQASNAGKRRSYLFMNQGGYLVDLTDTLAVDSSVAGDQGFLTPTNTRKVRAGDLDGDGDLDLVTANTNLGAIEESDPKHLTHPHVYLNLGGTGAAWLGFRYEEPRIPLLKTNAGVNGLPRFCGLDLGDVTGDGALDAYFVDYDGTETGFGENPSMDLDDKLLVNTGSAQFADESALRMSAAMLSSAFGTSGDLADMNGDGALDVLKTSTLGGSGVMVNYNNPANVGFFNFQQIMGSSAPYNSDTGDLNNDGRLDVVIADDGPDVHRYNVGNDAFGHIIWGALKTYAYVGGSDDGFGGESFIADLNVDGWNDAGITDVDHDVPGCSRRMHVFHNPIGAAGAQITLKEEAQSTSAGTGWKGSPAWQISSLTGTYEALPFDLDGDGDPDLYQSRCAGNFMWVNQTVLQPDLGFGGPGNARLTYSSTAPLSSAVKGHLVVRELAQSKPVFLLVSTSFAPTFVAEIGGSIVSPLPEFVLPLVSNAAGQVLFNNVTLFGPATVYVQALGVDLGQPLLFEISNVVRLDVN